MSRMPDRVVLTLAAVALLSTMTGCLCFRSAQYDVVGVRDEKLVCMPAKSQRPETLAEDVGGRPRAIADFGHGYVVIDMHGALLVHEGVDARVVDLIRKRSRIWDVQVSPDEKFVAIISESAIRKEALRLSVARIHDATLLTDQEIGLYEPGEGPDIGVGPRLAWSPESGAIAVSTAGDGRGFRTPRCLVFSWTSDTTTTSLAQVTQIPLRDAVFAGARVLVGHHNGERFGGIVSITLSDDYRTIVEQRKLPIWGRKMISGPPILDGFAAWRPFGPFVLDVYKSDGFVEVYAPTGCRVWTGGRTLSIGSPALIGPSGTRHEAVPLNSESGRKSR